MMLSQSWRAGDTAETYAHKQSECQQFVAACRAVIEIPRVAVEELQEGMNR